MNEAKIEKLDNAFLFILSLVGLIISFMQVTMRDLASLIDAIPFIVLGIVLPFFVGFMRGAIEFESVEERIRGWIYLIIGTSSYFAFFSSTWISMNYRIQYVYRESFFVLTVLVSSFITYRFLRWSKKVFFADRSLNQYVLSGTALCAIANAFLFSIVLGYCHDIYEKDLFGMLLSSSPEPLLWFSIILASFSIVLIFEKACRNALQTQLRMPTAKGRIARLLKVSLVKGILLGTVLLEYAFDYNLKARLLWLQSFVFWFLGCLFWIARVFFLSQLFFVLTIVLVLLGDFIFHRTRTMTFQNIENVSPEKTVYMMLIFASTTLMLLADSALLGLIIIVLFTISELVSFLARRNRTRADR